MAVSNPIAAIVLIDGADKVALTNLTIDGAANAIAGCAPNLIGIYYRNSSGKIDSVAVRNIRLAPSLAGCQSGLGIFAQSGGGGSSKVDVLNSSVHDFQKNGITGNESGTDINISGNSVSGDGPSPIIAQNGIQIGFGAKGTVQGNSANNVIYGPCTSVSTCGASATGILIFDAESARVMNNNVANTQTGIYLQSNKGEVSNNTIFQSKVFDGVAVFGDNNNVNGNSIFNSDESGVFVQGNKNDVNGNTINEAPVGILESAPSSGNNFGGGNKFFNTGMNVEPANGLATPSFSTTSTPRAPAQP